MSGRGWGFTLSEIRIPVHLWHGETDRLVSRSMAERLAAEIPDCTAHYVPEAGHLLTEHPDVVRELVAVFRDEHG